MFIGRTDVEAETPILSFRLFFNAHNYIHVSTLKEHLQAKKEKETLRSVIL